MELERVTIRKILEMADVMNEQINSLIESGQPIMDVLKNYLIIHRKEVIEEVFEKIKQLKVIEQGYADQNKWYRSLDMGLRYLKKELRK